MTDRGPATLRMYIRTYVRNVSPALDVRSSGLAHSLIAGGSKLRRGRLSGGMASFYIVDTKMHLVIVGVIGLNESSMDRGHSPAKFGFGGRSQLIIRVCR